MIPRTVPLTIQLLLTLLAVIVGTVAGLGLLAERSSRHSLEQEASRAVGIAAEGRAQTLVQLLTLRQQRAAGFLTSVTSSCGERAPSGRLGWEPACVRTALGEFRTTERAASARLRYAGRELAVSGLADAAAAPEPGALARVVSRPGGGFDYVMRAAADDLSIALRFEIEDLYPIFLDRYGLGDTGELLLIDREGRFLTPPRHAVPEGDGAAAPRAAAVRACVNGESGEAIADDYRGTRTIHGFRAVPEIGGGCVDAHLAYAEALAPAEALRHQLVIRSVACLAVGVVVSLLASAWIAAPIRRLAWAARALQGGQFHAVLPLRGPSEIAALGRTFDAMTRSIAELLEREHDARVEAESANRSKDAFLATVSHELRTPLNAIVGWVRLLRSGALGQGRTAHAVAAIERNAEAQAHLIEDLIDVSRTVGGTLRITKQAMPLGAAVHAAVETLRPQIEQKGVVLAVDIPPAPVLVSGDPRRLTQVVWNLLSNAVKFTPTGGRVEVQLRREADGVELTVRDSGVGIAHEFLPRVFDRFAQADTGPSRQYSGLGLGLAIVRHLVELHGGAVRAESAGIGHGAAFVVTLPAVDGSSEAAPC